MKILEHKDLNNVSLQVRYQFVLQVHTQVLHGDREEIGGLVWDKFDNQVMNEAWTNVIVRVYNHVENQIYENIRY